MLASITPFGERSRGFSWGLTASAFAIGAILGGAAAGAVAGALGSLLPHGTQWRWIALLVLLAITLLFDASPLRRWLPTSRRQVNQDWLGRYRGWVYGIGFGAQLGVGVATIVSSAAIYAAAIAALLAGSLASGALVGATFGAVRALALLPARSAVDHSSLVSLHRRLHSLDAHARQASYAAEFLMFVAVIGRVA
jgi:MFS family permease